MPQAFVPLQFDPADAIQVDWGECFLQVQIPEIDDIIIGMYARGLTYDKTDFGSD